MTAHAFNPLRLLMFGSSGAKYCYQSETYVFDDSFSALQCDVDVSEDGNRHSFYEICQIRMTSHEVFQFAVAYRHINQHNTHATTTLNTALFNTDTVPVWLSNNALVTINVVALRHAQ